MCKQKNKRKQRNKKSNIFYRKWWFWLIITFIFAGTWCFIAISDLDLRNSIIGICAIWGSTIATIFIGIIAAKQGEYFTFITHKQNIINQIKDNQTFFLTDIHELRDIGQYYELLTNLICSSNDEDVVEKTLPRTIQKTKIIETIKQFILVSETYQYCPVSIPELRKECENFMTFIVKEFNESNLPDPGQDPEEFKKKAKNLSSQVIKHMNEINKLSSKVTTEMQFLINELSKKKSLKELTEFENKILSKTKQVREKLLGLKKGEE
ncbi:MAG: hypothetical protein NC132_01530 [Corallococcus sp.]|nr:hypothetical protein [Corallococcus sp.]MCM1359339.1 hypothetical protein [Corallococcus sp.]MCM1394782.1 hypothetical protein [Corallococcus sp.]